MLDNVSTAAEDTYGSLVQEHDWLRGAVTVEFTYRKGVHTDALRREQ